MFIYKITNTEINRIYVGMTKRTLEERFSSHCYEARTQKYNMYLHNAIRKHGQEKFQIELLEECDQDIAADRERYWIRELNTIQPNGYNEHEGGKGGCLNPSPELREKLRRAKLGNIPWNKGLTKQTDDRIAKAAEKSSISHTGKTFTEEHKKNLRGPRASKKLVDSVSRLN